MGAANRLRSRSSKVKSIDSKSAEKSSISDKREWISPEQAAEEYPISVFTIYDWRYRPRKYNVPPGLTQKFGRKVFISRSVLEYWVATRNSE